VQLCCMTSMHAHVCCIVAQYGTDALRFTMATGEDSALCWPYVLA
jgi:dihydroxyacetone kinase